MVFVLNLFVRITRLFYRQVCFVHAPILLGLSLSTNLSIYFNISLFRINQNYKITNIHVHVYTSNSTHLFYKFARDILINVSALAIWLNYYFWSICIDKTSISSITLDLILVFRFQWATTKCCSSLLKHYCDIMIYTRFNCRRFFLTKWVV